MHRVRQRERCENSAFRVSKGSKKDYLSRVCIQPDGKYEIHVK
jgi:hypothetical protein